MDLAAITKESNYIQYISYQYQHQYNAENMVVRA